MANDSALLPEEIRNISIKVFKASFPEQTYAITLEKKFGCTVIGDVFDEKLKDCKKLSELRSFIVANAETITEPAASGPISIPACAKATPLDSLRQFVVEYAGVIAKENRKSVFSGYYLKPAGRTALPYSMDEVAGMNRLTRERVRQILSEESSICGDLLSGNVVNGLTADPDLVSWFNSIDAKISSVISIDELRKLTGTTAKDIFLERFLFDALSLNISKDKNLPEIACRKNINLKDFVREIGTITRFFREEALPVSEESFKNYLKIKFARKDLVQAALWDYVNTVSDYEKLTGEDGTAYIALKWERLEFLPSEVARLLYDRKVFKNEDAWSRDQIADAYNGLAKIHRMKPMDRNAPHLFKHAAVLALGKSGKYRLTEYSGETFISGKDFAIDFVKKNGTASTMDAFLEECRSKGYIHIYDEKTMASFFSTANSAWMKGIGKSTAHTPIEKTVEYAATTLLSVGGEAGISELRRQIKAKLGVEVSDSSLRQALTKADDLFELSTVGVNRVMAKLLVGSISSVDFTKYASAPKARKAPAYKSVVVATAVDELRSAPDHKMLLADLTKKLKKLIPSDLASNNIYKVFSDDSLFVKTPCGKNRFYVSLNPATYKEEYVDKATVAESEDKTIVAKIEAEEKPFTWDRLRTVLCAQYKSLESISLSYSIDKMVDRMYKIMCDGDSSVKPGTEFYKVLSLLYSLYTTATSPNDRELLCLKAILGMEPYLKSLYRLHNGSEMTSNGLGTTINYLERIGLMPDRNAYDKLGSEISDKTGRIINKRNSLHDNFKDKASDALNMFNIDVFMRYYLLVAAYSIKKGK